MMARRIAAHSEASDYRAAVSNRLLHCSIARDADGSRFVVRKLTLRERGDTLCAHVVLQGLASIVAIPVTTRRI